MKIGIRQLKVEAIIGIYPKEREDMQELLVDVEVGFAGEINNDSIDSTLNYEKIVDICKNTALEKKYFLIESFAMDIMDKFFDLLPILEATVCVTKPRAFKDCVGAYVEI